MTTRQMQRAAPLIVIAIGLVAFGAMRWRMPRVAPAAAIPAGEDTRPVENPAASSEADVLAEAELYFRLWGGYAVWADDVTEFAIWAPETQAFARFFSVTRQGGQFRFSRIPRLTRPLIDHGLVASSPIWFTEPKAARASYYASHPDAVPGPALVLGPTFGGLPPRPPERRERPAGGQREDASGWSTAPVGRSVPSEETETQVERMNAFLDRYYAILDRVPEGAATPEQAKMLCGALRDRRQFLARLVAEDAVTDAEGDALETALLGYELALLTKRVDDCPTRRIR